MKRTPTARGVAIFIALVVLLPSRRSIAGPATQPATPSRALRVLFIGNSYTQVNDLPSLFRKAVAGARLPAPLVDSVTPGGKTLLQHLSDPATLDKIDGGFGPRHLPWDVVVLQEQSQIPAFAEVSREHREKFLAGVVGLYDRVKAKHPDATVVLYQTWARHPDDWKNRRPDGMGKDADEMQQRLSKWYAAAAEHVKHESQAARKEDVTVAPVGDAWATYTAEKDAARLRLHAADNSHPAAPGTYLAALVMFQTIYHPPDLKTIERGTLPEAAARRLQEVAERPQKGP